MSTLKLSEAIKNEAVKNGKLGNIQTETGGREREGGGSEFMVSFQKGINLKHNRRESV